jgi:phospholipase C
MANNNRRTFLKAMAGTAAGAAFAGSIGRALAIPAQNRSGGIEDVEHIVIFMQENRSFDHYFGTLRGVRGFGDPRAVRLPSGNPVWYQPNGNGMLLPFHPAAPNLGLQFLQDLPHGWTDQHAAWNNGNHDGWVAAKGTTTMAYLTREDIPFQYALADAFTICDNYHCSVLGPTDPNRYYMWTGWVGNDGSGGGPVIDNAEAGYGWSTYPELLQQAGITWKIYQDVGVGLTAAGYWGWTEDAYIGNYGDNSLLYFHQYQNAAAGTPLAVGAKTGTNISVGGTLFDLFRQDVSTGKLPQVSWIVAPEAYTEHPNWPANYGAWYVSQILDALTANPEVWSKTTLFLMYDENDGFFDHLVPPTAPQSRAQGLSTVDTTNEIFGGNNEYATGPYGLGFRVPMIVVSPWTKGGFVCSQLFDHTSLIRFIETRFGKGQPGLTENNITAWRRAVCGDLTSAFNFSRPNEFPSPLPGTSGYVPPDNNRHPDYVPAPPAQQSLPTQEHGVRAARALPYELHCAGFAKAGAGVFQIDFANAGSAGACFQVRSNLISGGPWTYTVGAGSKLADSWGVSGGKYDLAVYGPNGFYRQFRGSTAGNATNVVVETKCDGAAHGIALSIANLGAARCEIEVRDLYTGEMASFRLAPGQRSGRFWPLRRSYGWYDLVLSCDGDAGFAQRFAGHVETGWDSFSDPAIGGWRLEG